MAWQRGVKQKWGFACGFAQSRQWPGYRQAQNRGHHPMQMEEPALPIQTRRQGTAQVPGRGAVGGRLARLRLELPDLGLVRPRPAVVQAAGCGRSSPLLASHHRG